MTVDLDVYGIPWAEGEEHTNGEYRRYANTPTGISPMVFPPTEHLSKWNSYEHDDRGITTEDADAIRAMQDKRARKGRTLEEHLARRRRGEPSELLDTLIAYDWKELLGPFTADPAEIVWG